MQTNHFSLDVSGACEGNLNVAVEDLEIEILNENKTLKEKIAYEAQNLNMLKEKVAKLPF